MSYHANTKDLIRRSPQRIPTKLGTHLKTIEAAHVPIKYFILVARLDF